LEVFGQLGADALALVARDDLRERLLAYVADRKPAGEYTRPHGTLR